MRKIITLLKRRGKRGFTLVEMIVAVALLAIMMAGMMLFVAPVLRNFNDNARDINAENVAYCVQEYITRSIRNANQIYIVSDTTFNAVNSRDTIQEQVGKMNTYCSGYNGTAVNKTYLLKCLSLRWVPDLTGSGGKYMLCQEDVQMATGGKLNTDNNNNSALNDTRMVFNASLYRDLYSTFEFSMPQDLTDSTVSKLRDDALQYEIKYYSDAAQNAVVFDGTGITELRQIKVQLGAKASAAEYYCKIDSDAANFSAEEVHNDIYIYYVVRNLSAGITPTT